MALAITASAASANVRAEDTFPVSGSSVSADARTDGRSVVEIDGKPSPLSGGVPEASDNCWVRASDRYGVDPWLLYSIATQESGLNPGAIGKNRNGTYDIGVMQINSIHLPRLAKYGIRLEHLWEPCMNIHVGAWVLAQAIREFGANWNAVGAYNAGTARTEKRDALRAKYASRVHRIYRRYVSRLHEQP